MAILAPRANLKPMLDIVAWIIRPELGRPRQVNLTQAAGESLESATYSGYRANRRGA
jgi:hypothetical protein